MSKLKKEVVKKLGAEFFADLEIKVESLRDDVSAFFDKGNKAAGRRIRKTLQDIKKAIKPWRDGIQDHIKSL